MRLADVSQSQEIDHRAQKDYGLTADSLMESAGSLTAIALAQDFPSEIKQKKIVIFCGPGNNGGDGWVVARHLRFMGADVSVIESSEARSRSELNEVQRTRALENGISVLRNVKDIFAVDLIIDAIFGIGLSRPVGGLEKDWIKWANRQKCRRIALDTPSGLDASTGVIQGIVFKAHVTYTYGLAKVGFFLNHGPECVGRLRVLNIGFPVELSREVANSNFLFGANKARRFLPKRKNVSNKSSYGRLLVIAGHGGTWGAGLLSSVAAFRMGAGYVIWMSEKNPSAKIQKAPEVMTAATDQLQSWLKKATAVVVGPGLGVNNHTAEILKQLVSTNLPAVIDADALTVLSQSRLKCRPQWVLTPHAGEMSRLIDRSVEEINNDRCGAAREAAQKWKCLVLLKGFRTVLSDGEKCWIIASGNASLAKAGSGDVLSGMIGSLLGQSVKPLPAAATAAYVHGRVADDWLMEKKSSLSLNPSDINDRLPEALRSLSHG